MFRSLRSRILVLGVVAVLGVLVLLAVAERDRGVADAAFTELEQSQLPSSVAVARVVAALSAVRAATEAAFATPDRAEEPRQRREGALRRLEREMAALESLAAKWATPGEWSAVDGQLGEAIKADDATWLALAAGAPEQARSSLGAARRSADAALEALDRRLDRELLEARARAGDGRAHLAGTTAGVLVLIGLLVVLVLVATTIARELSEPIAALRAASDAFGRGELAFDVPPWPGHELEPLRQSLAAALEAQRTVVLGAEAVATGDSLAAIVPRGPRDQLAGAVNTLAATLRDAADQADVVAAGNYDVRVVVRGAKDRLGLSLERMTATLREATQAAERIAAGDLDARVGSRGAEDRIARAVNGLASTLKEAARQAKVIASGDYAAEIEPRGPADELGHALRDMTRALREAKTASKELDWLKTGVAAVNELVLGESDVQRIAAATLGAVARHLDAKVGALYAVEHDERGPALVLSSGWAYAERKSLANRFRLGEGLVGQVAVERAPIVLQRVPEDYVRVTSGLGDTAPRAIVAVPVLFKQELRGVLELGTLAALTAAERQYVEQVAAVLGIALEMARAQLALRAQQDELEASNVELKNQTLALERASHELRAQQVELEQSNAELEQQMARARDSEARLEVQQSALERTNAELELRNRDLERQKADIEMARTELTRQAEELSRASKYKSEFLANMSHELRTPLNSLLLLARSLRDDGAQNLTGEQRESAGVIYSSGSDLLNLINEILDLSKIEAGRMDLKMDTVELSELTAPLERQFAHMAVSQGLDFRVQVAPGAPRTLVTDGHRLGQVLKNLVGNAMKFTEQGSVTVTFGPAGAEEAMVKDGQRATNVLAIRVADTGIGIPADKQRIVFEAFQQADSGDRRKYGGTGLGLSISRELVALLGGELRLVSQPGVGSTFTVLLPTDLAPSGRREVDRVRPSASEVPGLPPAAARPTLPPPPRELVPPATAPAPVGDDRDALTDADRVMLIIEDDARFVAVLLGEVRRRGFKGLAALSGRDGLALAKAFRPHGVILDLHLPDMDGWSVLGALKHDVDTRHIPVHIVSAEEASMEGLRIGAIGHAHKPLRSEDVDSILASIERSSASAQKLVLVVEDDPVVRRETVRLVGNGAAHVVEADTGKAALTAILERRFDLVVLDLGLPDMAGLELLRAASAARANLPPVIVYTVRELTPDEELSLRAYADSIIIKDVRSQERLVDEIALFLHRVVNDLPEEAQRTIRHLHESDANLRGKQVLIVEDDMRTMFAMAKLLGGHGLGTTKAANGEQALAALERAPNVDLVLMDMMMPVMDGYEAMRRIRAVDRFANLPIIALTAKAMREDRQRCIEAGASDYLTKPIDQDRLLSLMRVWLSR